MCAQHVTLTALQFVVRFFERVQTLFPFPLQATRHETVLGFDRAIAVLGPFGPKTHPLDRQLPLFKGLIVVRSEMLGGLHKGRETIPCAIFPRR